MAYNGDWLPASREEQLEMAKSWLTIMKIKGKLLWKMDDDLIADFEEAITRAQDELFRPKKTRTAGTNVLLKEAFENLVAKMRYIKNNYLVPAVMTDEDRVNMGLHAKDTTPTHIGRPAGKVAIRITYTPSGALLVNMTPMEENAQLSKAHHGRRIYYGVYAAGETPPATGKDLRMSKYSHHKREEFGFQPEDKGKTAYFCVRYENNKGDAGDWGPMVSAVIP